MPVIFFKASDFGVTIDDTHVSLNTNKSLIDRMNIIRIKIGEKTGFKNVEKSVIPKIALVLKAKKGDIASRYFMPWQCHPTYAVTGSIALAAACKARNTICSEFYKASAG